MFLVIFKHCDVGDSFKAGFITVEVTKKTNFSMPSNLYWNSTCNYLKHLLNLLFQNGKEKCVTLSISSKEKDSFDAFLAFFFVHKICSFELVCAGLDDMLWEPFPCHALSSFLGSKDICLHYRDIWWSRKIMNDALFISVKHEPFRLTLNALSLNATLM